MADLAADAQALQEILSDLTTLTTEQLVQLFRQYGDHPEFGQTLRTALPEIVNQHAEAAALVAAQWYNELDPASDYEASPVVDIPDERIDASARWALYAPGNGAPLDRLAGSTSRMVYDAARDTITTAARDEGKRWVRYAQPDACAFCRMLATRITTSDGLYLTEQSAREVVGRNGRPRGTRALGELYHDCCRCVPVAVPAGEQYEPPDHVRVWEIQYERAVDAVGNRFDTKAILAHMRSQDPEHPPAGSASTAPPPRPSDLAPVPERRAERPQQEPPPPAPAPPRTPPPPPPPPSASAQASPDDDDEERAAYRAQNRRTRVVETIYAEPAVNVVAAIEADPGDRTAETQLAQDLSGVYGPYRVRFQRDGRGPQVAVFGHVFTEDGTQIGETMRSFSREGDYLIVDHDLLRIDDEYQGRGFSAAYYRELEDYYRRSDVDLIRIHAALTVGGYAWARRGFTWDPYRLAESFGSIRGKIRQLINSGTLSDRDKNTLLAIHERLDANDPGQSWPQPEELAKLSGDETDLGRTLMLGANWYGVYALSEKGNGYGT